MLVPSFFDKLKGRPRRLRRGRRFIDSLRLRGRTRKIAGYASCASSTMRAQVRGPTAPLASRPACCCTARTAFSVASSKSPVTVSGGDKIVKGGGLGEQALQIFHIVPGHAQGREATGIHECGIGDHIRRDVGDSVGVSSVHPVPGVPVDDAGGRENAYWRWKASTASLVF